MITSEHKLEGWIKITKRDVYHQKCPYCEELSTGATVMNKTDVKCPKCNKKYPFKGNTVKLTKDALECSCGEIVSLIDDHKSGIGEYICPICDNVLAIEYNNNIEKPEKVLSPKWLTNELKNAENVYNDIYAIDSDHDKVKTVFRIIHIRVVMKEKKHNFVNFRYDTQKGILFFDKYNMEYIGCIVWSEDEEKEMNILRQIFVFKDKRKCGYGTQIMKYWIDNYGLSKYPTFGVESPNYLTFNILIKLGYVKIINGKIEKINWHFIYNG